MPRIKKRGLDYFPMNTDFIQNRIVRRIMKRNGDGALATLLGAISCIYADQGYYVLADSLFYEDLSTNLYETSTDQAKAIIALAVEYGFFDADLFNRYGILTSSDIQRQYLFSTKRRKSSALDLRFCLISDAQDDADVNSGDATLSDENATLTQQDTTLTQQDATLTQQDATLPINESVTFMPENVTSGTHSIAHHSTEKHSVAQKSTENSLLNSSPKTGGTHEGAEEESAEEDAPSKRSKSHREWTEEDISRMTPPKDNLNRNLDGLLANLRQFRIPPQEQYAIILKSNFGVIGHPMWKGFFALRESHGKIRQPGRYLLSLCNKKTE